VNTKRDSSFLSAMSVLKRVQNFGVRVRFSSNRATVGLFFMDGKVEEVSSERLLVRGENCLASVDWESCPLREVEDMSTLDTGFSFFLKFTFDDGSFLDVVGLDPLPAEPTGMVN
jgi:hypothetical protein